MVKFINLWGSNKNMPDEFSAGIVLFRLEDRLRKYLLLHYQGGHWDFPKGHIEEGENEKEAATRELTEETGIKKIQFIDGFSDKMQYFYQRDGKTMHKEVVYFLAETKEKKVKISHEHIGYEWLNYKDSLKRLTYKNAKDILERAYNFY